MKRRAFFAALFGGAIAAPVAVKAVAAALPDGVALFSCAHPPPLASIEEPVLERAYVHLTYALGFKVDGSDPWGKLLGHSMRETRERIAAQIFNDGLL
jgi:hypothetical protein